MRIRKKENYKNVCEDLKDKKLTKMFSNFPPKK